MLAALFSPNGHMSPASFIRAALVLILVTILINALPMVSMIAGSLGKFILMPIIAYCWIAIFMKRFRWGGKSGWMCLLAVAVFAVAYFAMAATTQVLFGGELYTQYQEALNDAMAEGLDFTVMMQISEQYAEPLARKIALPGAFVYALVSFVIAWAFDKLIPDLGGAEASEF